MLVTEGPPLEIGDALHLVMEQVSLPDAEDLERSADAICAEAGIPEHTDEVIELARRCLDESDRQARARVRHLPARGAVHRPSRRRLPRRPR